MKMKDNYTNDIYELCKNHMHAYVLAEMVDGTKMDGIVTGLDDEYVYFALPLEQGQDMPIPNHSSHEDNRQYGYGHPGYGGSPGYGYGGPGYGYHSYGRPPRRFRRLVLPLAALTAISLLPWY